MTKFNPGDQIAYIPNHADGDILHDDVQTGFVVRQNDRNPDTVFCRYWLPKKYWRNSDNPELRTKANSEGTPVENLKPLLTVKDPHIVDAWERFVTPVTGDPLPKSLFRANWARTRTRE